MITRLERHTQFVLFSCAITKNRWLTLEELGLYMTMLVRPDPWDFYEKALAKETGKTPEEILRLLRSLEQKKFVIEQTGKFGRYWDLYEVPYTWEGAWGNCAEPQTVQAKTETPTQKPKIPPTETRRLTNEEMAQRFFDQAEKLRKIAQAKRMAGLKA